MSSSGDRRIAFTYWSDPLCIWAYVAQDKLDRILREWGEKLDVSYRIVPVFGSLPWRFSDGPWATGGPEGRAAATRKVAEDFGVTNVSGEVWCSDCPASSWSAAAALKVVSRLEDEGAVDAGCFAAYQWRMRERFFVDNRNMARRSEQLALAEEMDLPRAPMEASLDDGSAWAMVWEDHHERERLLIEGSPTYVFDGGRAKLFGNFSEDVLNATVKALVCGLDPGCSSC